MSDNGNSQIKKGKLSQFKPATSNSNRHTARGMEALGNAMSEVGYVVPVTVAADGEALDGSARLEKAFEKFGDEALIIKHDGTRPVVMVREDIPNAQTPLAKKLAISANRIGQLDLDWDTEQILADMRDGLDLGNLWNEAELGEMIEDALLAEAIANSLTEPVNQSEDRKLGDKRKQIKPVLYVDELATFEKAITATGNPNRGHAIIQICQDYLDAKGQLDL